MLRRIMSSVCPLFGFCPFSKIKDHLLSCRAVSRIPKNAKTVITAVFPYRVNDEIYKESNISKYAVVPDYHITAGNLLNNACEKLKDYYPNEEFAAFIDNSPVPEVKTAVLSGIGVKGKNGLLITKEFGSWVFIGEIITTMDVRCPDIDENSAVCLNCGKCIKACPVGAITKSGVDRTKCLSAVTQKKGELTDCETALIRQSGCAWGCDICQNICPMNRNAALTDISEFISKAEPIARTENISDRAYAWRGKKVIERNLKILDTST